MKVIYLRTRKQQRIERLHELAARAEEALGVLPVALLTGCEAAIQEEVPDEFLRTMEATVAALVGAVSAITEPLRDMPRKRKEEGAD